MALCSYALVLQCVQYLCERVSSYATSATVCGVCDLSIHYFIQVLMVLIYINNMTRMRFQGILVLCKHHLLVGIFPTFQMVIVK